MKLPLPLRPLLLLPVILAIGLLAFRIEIALPATLNLNNTLTLFTTPTPQEIGSYDRLGQVISRDEAAALLQTEGRRACAKQPQSPLPNC